MQEVKFMHPGILFKLQNNNNNNQSVRASSYAEHGMQLSVFTAELCLLAVAQQHQMAAARQSPPSRSRIC